MITYVVCDLFTSPARTLVNTVNTVGVMGKGIAKDFKTIYPEMFARYQELCEKGQFDIGQLWLYRTPNKWVLNFPTKRSWRSPSHPDYIEAGLQTFAATYHVYGITSISFPLLGCGNGELHWDSQVQPLMEKYLGRLPIDVYIHLLHRTDPFTPEHRNIRETKKWLRGEPESLSFSEVWPDLITAIAADPYIVTIDDQETCRVRIGVDEASVELDKPSPTAMVQYDELLDLWQQLRTTGFLGREYLPGGLNEQSAWLIPLMSKLDYIRPVHMAEQSSQSGALAVGLRIIPGAAAARQPQPLLTGVSVVEPE